MITKIPSPKDLIDFTKKNGVLLYAPIIKTRRLRDFIPDITNKKIYSWELKKLIALPRYKGKNKGWRIASPIDTIKLHIIASLRRLGVNTSTIRSILNAIFGNSILPQATNKTFWSNQDFKTASNLTDSQISADDKEVLSSVEYSIFSILLGKRILLILTDVNGNKSQLLTEKEAQETYFAPSKGGYPFLSLPFYLYVQRIAHAVNMRINWDEDTLITKQDTNLSPKEKKIIELYRNNDYQEILIKKQNGTETILKPKAYRQGDFTIKDFEQAVNARAFQKVTAVQVNGKTISIINEETIKV